MITSRHSHQHDQRPKNFKKQTNKKQKEKKKTSGSEKDQKIRMIKLLQTNEKRKV